MGTNFVRSSAREIQARPYFWGEWHWVGGWPLAARPVPVFCFWKWWWRVDIVLRNVFALQICESWTFKSWTKTWYNKWFPKCGPNKGKLTLAAFWVARGQRFVQKILGDLEVFRGFIWHDMTGTWFMVQQLWGQVSAKKWWSHTASIQSKAGSTGKEITDGFHLDKVTEQPGLT